MIHASAQNTSFHHDYVQNLFTQEIRSKDTYNFEGYKLCKKINRGIFFCVRKVCLYKACDWHFVFYIFGTERFRDLGPMI